MNKTHKQCPICKEVKEATTENFYQFGETEYFSKRCISCQKAANKIKQEIYRNRVAEKQKQKVNTAPSVQKQKIPYFSEKGRQRHNELLKVKNEVRQNAFDNNEYYCKGCGMATGLDCSHNIGLGQSMEAAKDYDNLVLLCRVCHAKYESNDPVLMNQLACIDSILEYLMFNHPEKYYKKMYKLNRIT